MWRELKSENVHNERVSHSFVHEYLVPPGVLSSQDPYIRQGGKHSRKDQKLHKRKTRTASVAI